MTDNDQKLDIAQRIAEALSRTSEPKMTSVGDFQPNEDTVLGEVPEHLRHLHNLLQEIGDEVRAAEELLREVKKHHGVIHTIFFAALEQHVPTDRDKFDGTKLCTDWKVVGFRSNESDDDMDGLGAMLAMMMADHD